MSERPEIPNGHFPRLPWRVDPSSPHRVLDADGVPVAWGSSTTSIREQGVDERGHNFTSYRTTETVNAIRARIIVEAVNFVHGEKP